MAFPSTRSGPDWPRLPWLGKTPGCPEGPALSAVLLDQAQIIWRQQCRDRRPATPNSPDQSDAAIARKRGRSAFKTAWQCFWAWALGIRRRSPKGRDLNMPRSHFSALAGRASSRRLFGPVRHCTIHAASFAATEGRCCRNLEVSDIRLQPVAGAASGPPVPSGPPHRPSVEGDYGMRWT